MLHPGSVNVHNLVILLFNGLNTVQWKYDVHLKKRLGVLDLRKAGVVSAEAQENQEGFLSLFRTFKKGHVPIYSLFLSVFNWMSY